MHLLLALTLLAVQQTAATPEQLWNAAKAGDTAGVEAALAAGVPVDAPTRYQQTALMFAAQFGHADLVALLLAKGANPNQKDSFYGVTPMTAYQMSGGAPNPRILQMLVEKGADTLNPALNVAVQIKDQALLRAVLASPKLNAAPLPRLLTAAQAGGDPATRASERQIDIQQKTETRYLQALTTLLTPLVGAGNFTAEVHADLDFAEVQATRESYPKDLATVRAEQGAWNRNRAVRDFSRQRMLDDTATPGLHFYEKSHFLAEIDRAVPGLLAHFGRVPSPRTHVILGALGGAVARTAPDATAFGHREAPYLMWAIGAWEPGADAADGDVSVS